MWILLNKMCQKRSSKKTEVFIHGEMKTIRVDACIYHLPLILSNRGFEVVACCCGHGRYPLTIVCRNNFTNSGEYFDLISGVEIPRKKRYYFKDKKGYFYIPEVIKNKKKGKKAFDSEKFMKKKRFLKE